MNGVINMEQSIMKLVHKELKTVESKINKIEDTLSDMFIYSQETSYGELFKNAFNKCMAINGQLKDDLYHARTEKRIEVLRTALNDVRGIAAGIARELHTIESDYEVLYVLEYIDILLKEHRMASYLLLSIEAEVEEQRENECEAVKNASL